MLSLLQRTANNRCRSLWSAFCWHFFGLFRIVRMLQDLRAMSTNIFVFSIQPTAPIINRDVPFIFDSINQTVPCEAIQFVLSLLAVARLQFGRRNHLFFGARS